MFNSLNDIRKITDKTKGKVLGWTISYMIAKLVELVESNSSIDGLWEQRFALLNISKPSNAMLWIGCVLSLLLYLTNWIVTVLAKRENPSINFRKIMREHTAKEIQEISDKSFSWGYNYCIHYSRDPRGWAPSAFFVSDYIEEEYRFPKKVEELPDYNKDSYNTYCNENPKVDAIRRKG
ncbi:MAG: hypothetical protein IKK96_01920, partial [Lachnospiraceae bacterium]|nr:hypothetical protein [Lachnospiraceae bacterium]